MADGGRHVPRTRVAIAVRGDGDARHAFPHGRGGDGDGDGSWGGDGRAVVPSCGASGGSTDRAGCENAEGRGSRSSRYRYSSSVSSRSGLGSESSCSRLGWMLPRSWTAIGKRIATTAPLSGTVFAGVKYGDGGGPGVVGDDWTLSRVLAGPVPGCGVTCGSVSPPLRRRLGRLACRLRRPTKSLGLVWAGMRGARAGVRRGFALFRPSVAGTHPGVV